MKIDVYLELYFESVVLGNISFTLDLKTDREYIDFMFSGRSFHKDIDEGSKELANNSVRLAITDH